MPKVGNVTSLFRKEANISTLNRLDGSIYISTSLKWPLIVLCLVVSTGIAMVVVLRGSYIDVVSASAVIVPAADASEQTLLPNVSLRRLGNRKIEVAGQKHQFATLSNTLSGRSYFGNSSDADLMHADRPLGAGRKVLGIETGKSAGYTRPGGGLLAVKLTVQNDRISAVQVGQRALIKMRSDSIGPRSSLVGVVSRITYSPLDSTHGPCGVASPFVVWVALPADVKFDGTLRSGMAGSAQIEVGSKPLLSLLFGLGNRG